MRGRRISGSRTVTRYRELMRALEARLIKNSGLSGADYALLHPLSEVEDGVLRTRDLGRSVGWERSRLSHQVSRMEKRGLVIREECASDARGSMVRLTAARPEGDRGRRPRPRRRRPHVLPGPAEPRRTGPVLTTLLDRILADLPNTCATPDCDE